jgi:hypothetical protein
MQVFESFLEFIQQVPGIILAVVIDHNDFVGAWIGLNQGSWQIADEFAGFIARANDHTDRMLL